MVPGSRFILSLLGEIEINAVGQMEGAEEKAHDAVGISEASGPIRNTPGKKSTSAQDEGPAEKPHAALTSDGLIPSGRLTINS